MNVPTENQGSPAGTRLAATVMLVRPSPRGSLELFMLRRSGKSAFAPDAYVFPGGTVDPADAGETARARTITAPDANLRHAEAFESGLLMAALREVFEEAGLLFAARADGTRVPDETIAGHADELIRARGEVHRGERTFVDVLRSIDAYADARELTRFSHWITPQSEPRRYNTYFFLARAPHAQTALADASETHDGRWIEPKRALEEHQAGALHLIYPTIKHLERIAAFEEIDALFEFAAAKPILTMMPNTVAERGFSIPPELDSVVIATSYIQTFP